MLGAVLALGIALLLGLVWRANWQRLAALEAAHAQRMEAMARQERLWKELLADDPCKAKAALEAGRP